MVAPKKWQTPYASAAVLLALGRFGRRPFGGTCFDS